MLKKKIIVLVSGNGTNFEAIAKYIQNKQLSAEIQTVISDRPEAYALIRAENLNIPTYVINYKTYNDPQDFQNNLFNYISYCNPDLIILAGFMRILSRNFVEHFLGRCINIHPALLPKFTGLHTHERALAAKESEHGISIHFVIPELDAGPIIAQSKLKIYPEDTKETLKKRIQALEVLLYPLIVEWFIHDRLKLTSKGIILDKQLLPPQGYLYETE